MNRFGEWIRNHLVSGYILSGNLLCLYRISHKVITPLDVLNLPMKLQILSELDGNSIVIQHINKIINSWSEMEI